MKRRWSVDELADQWTLHADELSMAQSSNTSSNQLGFALMLKWFQYEGQFPKRKQEIPMVVVDFLAQQMNIPPGEFKRYSLQGRTVERQRAQIRQYGYFCIIPRGNNRQKGGTELYQSHTTS